MSLRPKSKLLPALALLLLFGLAFSLAAIWEPRVSQRSGRDQSASVLDVLFGDGRRLFANHFFVKADVYFHSGYYPSIFDAAQTNKDSHHLTEAEPDHEKEEHEHEAQMNFLGPPRDWIEAFGRHFLITQHSHLSGGNEREMLPWLRLSADLDPQNIETYTVAAYWLRRTGKIAEAQQFLREGLRANPTSYKLLFELGRLIYENEHDAARARNLWKLALTRWREQQAGKKEPDNFALEQITVNLAGLEEKEGNWTDAINYLEQTKAVSPHPEDLDKRIEIVRQKMKASPDLVKPRA